VDPSLAPCVILLTGRRSTGCVAGLDAGADDYVVSRSANAMSSRARVRRHPRAETAGRLAERVAELRAALLVKRLGGLLPI
jgi:DNA-binding response OmpR family regulator